MKEMCRPVERRLAAGERLSDEEHAHAAACEDCRLTARLPDLLVEARAPAAPGRPLGFASRMLAGADRHRRRRARRRMKVRLAGVTAAAAAAALLWIPGLGGERELEAAAEGEVSSIPERRASPAEAERPVVLPAAGARVFESLDRLEPTLWSLAERLELDADRKDRLRLILAAAERRTETLQFDIDALAHRLDAELRGADASRARAKQIVARLAEKEEALAGARLDVWFRFRELLSAKERAALPQLLGAVSVDPKLEEEVRRPPAEGPESESGCDEVTCLVSPERACCERYQSAEAPERAAGLDDDAEEDALPLDCDPSDPLGCLPEETGTDRPERLHRSDISGGIARVRASVTRCGADTGFSGRVIARITIEPSGRVGDVSLAGAPTGRFRACVANALWTARFPASQKGMTVRYPFIFR